MGSDLDARSRWRWILAGGTSVGLLFLLRSLVFLYRAHPQDDAYILFGYVRRLVAGEGIVFHSGGPHAEGATDFLWFALLSLSHRLGIDIAVSAALWNAAGGAVLGGLIAAVMRRSSRTPPAAVLVLLAPAALAGAATAATVGFGSLFFSAAVAWTYAETVAALEGGAGSARALRRIPLEGLVLGLIRPDGVVLGAGFVAFGGWAAARTGVFAPFARRVAVAILLGAAYFAWRWSYFGLPLPLPLYVKGHAASEFAGAALTRGWFLHASGAWPLLAAALLLLAIGGRIRGSGPPLRILALAATPVLVHLAVLALARQSQNVAFRFQAPAQTVLLLLLAFACLRAFEARSSGAARSLSILVVLAGVAPGVVIGVRGVLDYSFARTYVDVFGPRLGEILEPGDVVALGDQAGRIPFWSRARMIDLVGLNTPRTALAPPDQEFLREIDPDLVLLYTGRAAFDLEPRIPAAAEDVVPLAPATLAASVRAEQRGLYEHGIAAYGAHSNPDSACNVIAARFLVDSGTYDLHAVRYTGTFKHVYAIRRGHPRAARILEAIRQSVRPESYRSYAREAGLPFAGP